MTDRIDELRALLERSTPTPFELYNGYLIRAPIGDYCSPVAKLCSPYRRGVGIALGEREQWANGYSIVAIMNAAAALLACAAALRKIQPNHPALRELEK